MKKTICVLILLLLIFTHGCNNKTSKITEIEKKTIATLENFTYMYPDSSFFSDIRSMYYQNGKIYALDASRRDVGVLSENLSDFYTISQGGRGPGELVFPLKLFVSSDTVYIYDEGEQKIKLFNDKSFIKNIDISRFGFEETSFFVYHSDIYLPILNVDSATSIQIYKKNGDNYIYYLSAGEFFNFDHPIKNRFRNGRYLLVNDNSYFAVSHILPIIEEYSLEDNQLLRQSELSSIPVMERNLKYVKEKEDKENSFWNIISDTYIYGNYIYLLCPSWENSYETNEIIELEITPELKYKRTISLPASIYRSFCVNDNYIYAFNYLDSSIEKLSF